MSAGPIVAPVAIPADPCADQAKLRDDYSVIEQPHPALEACPVCAGSARLWRYAEDPTQPSSVAAMCDNADPIGPQDGMVNEGCLLYMPSDDFYRPTIRDAAAYWNSFATALVALRRKTERKAVQATIAARCPACAGSGEDFNEGDCCHVCGGSGKATT